jgi:putative DNA primase/helicase
LEGHGPANYQFRSDGTPSYYVKIVTNRGAETLWGVDLDRAMKQSKTRPQIGTVIGVQRVGSELVTLPALGANRAAGRPRTARRAQWVVESITFFAESLQRARRERESQLADERALRERPELRSAFISFPIAQKFAEQNIRDPRDRELFIERVKAVMALSAKNGAPITAPRRRASSAPAPTPRREDPTR